MVIKTLDLSRFEKKQIISTQFSNLKASLGNSTSQTGGQLRIAIEIGISDVINGNTIEGNVKFSVTGIPKNASPEDIAFEVAITSKVTWLFSADLLNITAGEKAAISEELCQPAFLLAVAEAKNLSSRIGFPQIRLPLDLSSIPDKKPKITSKAEPKKANIKSKK